MKSEDFYGACRIVSQPSAEDLRPTPEQITEQKRLLDWERRSKEVDWVVGEPYRF